jgi:hypothetical protein
MAPIFTGRVFGFGRSAAETSIVSNYFGDGSDGSLSTSGNVTYTVSNKSGSYDGDTVVLQYSSLTVNIGHILTVDQPCRGLVIYVNGNCTINGTISMTSKGGKSDPTLSGGSDSSTVSPLGLRWIFATPTPNGDSLTISPDLYAGCGTLLRNVAGSAFPISDGTIMGISRDGYGQPSRPNGDSGGFNGVSWTFTNPFIIGSGSGGGGSSLQNGSPYPGSAGEGGLGGCFSGGAGGGAAGGPSWPGTPLPGGGNYGGAGGAAYVGTSYSPAYGAGGVGNPPGANGGGTPSPVTSYGTGVGGMVVLIVGGTLTLGASASIQAKGIRGQTVNPPAGYRMQGGASGGGNILVVAKSFSGATAGSYVSADPTSKIDAGGGSGNPAGNGGNGGILLAEVL